jgi:hypothetical protein
MKRATGLALAVAIGLAVNGMYAVWARAEGPKPASTTNRMGKFVLVHDRVTNTALAVEQAEVQTVGGKPFLVGVGATGAKVRTPATGRPIWVNLEDATTVIHFESIEELEKAVQAAQEH